MSLQKWSNEIVDTPKKADRIFRRFRAAVLAERRSADPPKPPEPLLRDAIEEFYIPLHMIAKGRGYAGSERYRLAAIKERFGDLRGSRIRLLDVERWVFELRQRGCGPATVRRYVARLRALLNWVIDRDLIVRSPIRWRALDLAPEPKGRTRRFLPEEEARVKAAANPWLRQLIDFALDTGLRKGTLLGLTFGMVDFENGRLRVPRRLMKNKRSADDHVMALTQRAMAIVRFRKTGADGQDLPDDAFIFGTRDGGTRRNFRTAWRVALRAAGVPRDPSRRGWSLHFHDLRGEFASRLHEAGVPLTTIQHLLDHSTSMMTDRYLKVRMETKREAIEKLEAHNAMLAIKLIESQRKTESADEQAFGNGSSGTIH